VRLSITSLKSESEVNTLTNQSIRPSRRLSAGWIAALMTGWALPIALLVPNTIVAQQNATASAGQKTSSITSSAQIDPRKVKPVPLAASVPRQLRCPAGFTLGEDHGLVSSPGDDEVFRPWCFDKHGNGTAPITQQGRIK
jgi:hypothetical protein